MTVLDRYLPDPRFVERHQVEVSAPSDRTWKAIEDVDLARDPLTRMLLAVRGMRGPMRLRDFERFGFVVLATEPEREIVLGVVGRFWRPSGGIVAVPSEDFSAFERPGFLKAVWNVRVDDTAHGCVVSTETRVAATDFRALALFRPYWLVVRPFSGLIRRRMLSLVKADAELAL